MTNIEDKPDACQEQLDRINAKYSAPLLAGFPDEPELPRAVTNGTAMRDGMRSFLELGFSGNEWGGLSETEKARWDEMSRSSRMIDAQRLPDDPDFSDLGKRGEEKIAYQASGHPPQINTDGILHSPGYDYSLIPTVGMHRLAKRFSLGEERKGKGAWNALSDNQSALTSKRALLKRLEHAYEHIMLLRDKVARDLPFDDDDDAAAIAWCGFYAMSATDAIQRQRQEFMDGKHPCAKAES